ncbi:hypothetical protein HanRHA438_Chr07g0308251 [Helianthus annuus]|nr:hypothetical protein HanIR_Chr07g0321611 [Helianthus annuus]KAJ0908247.1 hypothetical protein HanRHA438_Chr07g0308251 [Helianthus annuus]
MFSSKAFTRKSLFMKNPQFNHRLHRRRDETDKSSSLFTYQTGVGRGKSRVPGIGSPM